MTHAILIQNSVAAKDNVIFNRSAISASNLDNGWLIYPDAIYSEDGYEEVWEVKQPTTGSLTDLWMVAAPVDVVTDSKYKGLDPDPRNFYTSASKVFDIVKLQKGDIITITADAFDGSTSSDYAVVEVDSYKFAWASVPSGSLTSLKHMEDTYVSVASGSEIGNQRVTAFKCEVIIN